MAKNEAKQKNKMQGGVLKKKKKNTKSGARGFMSPKKSGRMLKPSLF